MHDVRRIRLADGKPIVIEHSQFPAALFPGLLDCRLDGSLYELLDEKYGQRPHRAGSRWSRSWPACGEAEALEVDEGAPLMLVERTAYSRDRPAAGVRAGPVPRRPDQGRGLDLGAWRRPVGVIRGAGDTAPLAS